MRTITALLLCLMLSPLTVAAEDDLPPIYGGGGGDDDGDGAGEVESDGLPSIYGGGDGESSSGGDDFDLGALFGEGLEFIGRLDLWGRYYATQEDELGSFAEARFDLTSRSGATKVEVSLLAHAFTGYDLQYSGGEELDLELDRANVGWYTDDLELTLGRQKLARGPAYLFNPSDLFVNASFVDPTVEDPGVDALTGSLFFGRFSGVTATVVPRRYAADGTYGLRVFGNLAGFDCSAAYHHVGDYAPGVRDHFLSFWLNGDVIIGDWDGPGLWLELGWDLPYSDDLEVESTWRLDAGIEYTFGEDLTALVEYYHDEAGATEFTDYDWLSLATGDALVLGRDYLFASLDFDLASLITANALGLVNLADGGGLVGPGVRFNLSDNVNATLGGFLFFGPTESEFGHEGIELGGFTVPAYPHLAYLRVEAAF